MSKSGWIHIHRPQQGIYAPSPDGEGHAETIEVRCAIEGFCTHRIAGQLTTEKGKRLLEELEEILEQMRNAKMQTTATDLYRL